MVLSSIGKLKTESLQGGATLITAAMLLNNQALQKHLLLTAQYTKHVQSPENFASPGPQMLTSLD